MFLKSSHIGSSSSSGVSRRGLLKAAACAAGTVPALRAGRVLAVAARTPPQAKPFMFEEVTVGELQEKMKSGSLSASALTKAYLARIEELDKGRVNSMIEINPEARAIAASLDIESKAKGPRGPLHGIPVLIKDNIDTADKMQTTAGSLALVGSKPTEDSTVAHKLREAGAVILGKTNLSEWANIRSSHSTSGWSGRGGLTRNPYATDRNPCGSSSGSGAAVSANFCTIAVGTETDGSIVCPSSTNGIVGIKPTLGLISRRGIVPIAHSQDTAGPMARTVRDAAILLGVLAATDANDAATADADLKKQKDYTQFLDAQGLNGARIGVARKYFGFSDAVDKVMDEAISAMKSAGAKIVDPADLESHGKF
ncbi:MAG TPA: amidase family protein, partial [Terriglobales bacterium]|nr:amidase family protein [Terriglobales bacterium]